MPRPSRRRRLAPFERRAELLEAAEVVIRRHGAMARVEDIVHQAGTARGTFYIYFETWDDLLQAMRERVFEQLDKRFSAWIDRSADWHERILGLPGLFIDMTLELEGLHQAVLHGPISGMPPRQTRHDVIQRLTDLITEGIAAGVFNVARPIETARLAFAVLHEAADQVERGAPRETTIAAVQEMLVRSLELKNYSDAI